jgi:hypothetical protein
MSLHRLTVSGEIKDAAEHNAGTPFGATPAPFSLRLTTQERAILLREAGRTPLGAYIRNKLLGEPRFSPSINGKRLTDRRMG